MDGYVGLTNWDWFQFLSAEGPLDEVNFWRPSDTRALRLSPGAPFFFKLHQKSGGWIAGFGHFVGFSARQMWVAWEAFERKNGASNFAALHGMLAEVRNRHGNESDPAGNYRIGCLMISQPTFFPREQWVRPPADWPRTGLMGGKKIDVSAGEGERVWMECLARSREVAPLRPEPDLIAEGLPERYGRGAFARPRLGQGAFRLLVTDAYRAACAVTHEHSMPVLEAAHIRRYADGGPHAVENGLFLRTDIHKLFDCGYVTIEPETYRFVVSRRLKEDYENGRTYYADHGKQIQLPFQRDHHPLREHLEWHAQNKFKG